MGERRKNALGVRFDGSVKLEFHGAKVTSDAGLLAYRELDEALGLTSLAGELLSDCRIGKNTFTNFKALSHLCGKWVYRVHQHKPFRELILDLDSSVSPTHGNQEGSAYNGHFGCTCYHPLFCFNQFGDLERAMLRKGNVHSADEWRVCWSRS